MKVTYYGHSAFNVEIDGKHLVFDPFITPNELAKDINLEEIKADFIFVSHGHQDHIADTVALAKRTGATVVCAWEISVWLGKQGLEKVHPMNTGGKWAFDFGTVMCVSAVHSSGLPDGTYGGNPMGFVIWGKEGCFYFAGDTALTLDMKLIPMLCPPLNFAILPIGDNFTMDVRQAVFASDFIQCDQVIGCHFDTFGYIKIDHEAALKDFSDKGKTLILPEIGKTISL